MGHFSLQRVLDLKRRREEAMALRLAQARSTAEEARRSEEALDEQRREGAQQRATVGAVPVGQLQNSSYLLERLEQRLVDARAATKAADAAVDARLAEFTTALQERRVLDRLKEKRLEAAAAEEVKVDQSTMDAIALTRFVRTEKRDVEEES